MLLSDFGSCELTKPDHIHAGFPPDLVSKIFMTSRH